MTPAGEVIDAILKSAAELRVHLREPVRVRMHPLDSELLLAQQCPSGKCGRMVRFMGLDVVEDEAVRIGEPVAEFDP